MIKDNFPIRLNKLIEYYDLTAATFADKIGVPRSSISHILSGRNNPSLDFVLKIMNEFKEVDFNWLVLNKGSFPAASYNLTNSTLFDRLDSEMDKKPNLEEVSVANKVDTAQTSTQSFENALKSNSKEPFYEGAAIERIVVFFDNGTFKNYRP